MAPASNGERPPPAVNEDKFYKLNDLTVISG